MGSSPSDFVTAAAWSPCGRFIAFATETSEMIEVLDAVTLSRIKTLEAHSRATELLSFSSDSRILTGFGREPELTSWDFQTGGEVCTIPSEAHVPHPRYLSSTHSMDGRAVAVAYAARSDTSTAISVYDLVSRIHVYSHRSEERIVAPVWAHGERLRFTSVKPGYITTWEANFASIETLTEVEALRVPDEVIRAKEILYLPTLSRLAFTLPDAVLVWDAQNTRFILNFQSSRSRAMAFSPDSRFFACKTPGQGLRVFKESPADYVVHQELPLERVHMFGPSFSPDGESMAMCFGTLRLWRMEGPVPSFTQMQSIRSSTLDFSPDESLVAFSRIHERTITIIDLESGEPRLIIDTGTDILCLRMTESAIIVACDGKIRTWDLPGGDYALNTRANIDDSVQTVAADFVQSGDPTAPYTSISPNLDRIAIVADDTDCLDIYDVSTGECLTDLESIKFEEPGIPFFAPDGLKVWIATGESLRTLRGYSIVDRDEPGSIQLEPIEPKDLPSELPWQSSHGYRVVHDEWAHSPGGKRLLWLPHNWRLPEMFRIWRGRFVGLTFALLPEVVILELCE